MDSSDDEDLSSIQQAYLSAGKGLVSVKQLAHRLNVPEDKVLAEVKQLPAYQRTLPAKRSMYQITADPGYYQVDIAFLPYAKANEGYVGFVLAVEIATRKAYAYPLKSKTIESLMEVLKRFLGETKVLGISSDNEAALTSHTVREYLEQQGVEQKVYRVDDHNAMGVLDRLARTIKEMLQRYFLGHSTVRWLDALGEVIDNYNNKRHRGIFGMTPNEMRKDAAAQDQLQSQKDTHNKLAVRRGQGFEEGDQVRVLEPLKALEKGRPRYSAEVYTVYRQVGLSYMLKNAEGNVVRELRRPYELVEAQSAPESDVLAEWRKRNRGERRLTAELGKESEAKVVPRERRQAAIEASHKLSGMR